MKQRCNDCMSVFDEDLTECPECGRDDCLMFPFEPIKEEETTLERFSRMVDKRKAEIMKGMGL